MEMLDSAVVTLVPKMREIVILMMSVKMVFYVDQTIVRLHLVLILKLIVVINQLLGMNISVHLEFLVEKMKEIVTLIVNVKAVFFVDITTAWLHLVLTLNLIVVTSQLFVSLILKSEIDQILGQLKLTIEQISGTKGDCLIPD